MVATVLPVVIGVFGENSLLKYEKGFWEDFKTVLKGNV